MESLVSNNKYFKFNVNINQEPVEIRKNSCNMTELGRKSRCCLITFFGKTYSNEL